MASVSFNVTGTKAVTHDLTRFRQNIQKSRSVFVEMADHVAAMQRDQFDTEGRHYGPAWASLSPKYRAWKAKRRPGRPILVFDGDLRDAAAPATARGFDIYRVSDKGMEVGVSYTMTPHARYHQEGTETMRPRPLMKQPTKADQKALTKILHTHLVKGTSLTGGTR